MGCCCNNKENDRVDPRIPDGIDPCCNIRGKRCMCLPYNDGLVAAAQILAILALFFSWIWWFTFLVNIAGLVMFQLPWCCRQSSGAMYLSAVLAAFNTLIMMGLGVYVLVVWGDMNECWPFDGDTYKSSYNSNNPYNPGDKCQEQVWATIACVCAALWATAALCMYLFVKSGRHAKWEKQYTPSEAELAEASPEAVEQGDGPIDVGVALLEAPPAKVDDV